MFNQLWEHTKYGLSILFIIQKFGKERNTRVVKNILLVTVSNATII